MRRLQVTALPKDKGGGLATVKIESFAILRGNILGNEKVYASKPITFHTYRFFGATFVV